MDTRRATTRATRGIALLAVLGLLAILLYFLPKPGYSHSRLALFGVVAGVAVLGAAGVVFHRTAVAVAGALGLLLLGFTTGTVGVFAVPVAVLVLFAGLLDWEEVERFERV